MKKKGSDEPEGKQPGFYLYVADLERDLRPLSDLGKALWVEMLCKMHWAERRGYLEHPTGEAYTVEDISKLVSATTAKVCQTLDEMEHKFGTFSRETGRADGKNCIYNRRMVRDTEISLKRKAAGRLGGNPNLVSSVVKQNAEMVKQNENVVNHVPNHFPTLSSSSSFSSSNTHTHQANSDRFTEWITPWPRNGDPDSAARNWLSHVPKDSEDAAFACRDRYLASDDVSRGVVMEPWKFIMVQSKCGWSGKWPKKKMDGDYREMDESWKH